MDYDYLIDSSYVDRDRVALNNSPMSFEDVEALLGHMTDIKEKIRQSEEEIGKLF